MCASQVVALGFLNGKPRQPLRLRHTLKANPFYGLSLRRTRSAIVTISSKTLTDWSGLWLLDLRYLLQHGPGDISQQGIFVVGGDVQQDLPDARIRGDGGQQADGLGADLGVAVV